MRVPHGTAWLVIAIGFQVGMGVVQAQETALETPPAVAGAASEELLEVLARGPVHEAFAEQVSPDPQPGVIAPQAPPEPIAEEPPEWRPEGDDVMWIPGYWFWDEEREAYVWVSGVWRRVPPDREWVPGYWQPVEGGYQWIAGYWAPRSAPPTTLLTPPPASLEIGPTSPATTGDVFWDPGTWIWSPAGQYRWRAGHWHPFRPNWTWVGARYIWTPRGCVFVPGYWDFTLARRGFLFAPVFFRTPLYRQVGFVHRPCFWIGHDALLLHLFVSPRHCHLFFGDYYAPVYRQRHFEPCYDFHARHRGFASLYVYYEHHYRRQGIDYCGRVRDWHTYYVRHADRRPVHTQPLHGERHQPGDNLALRSADQIVRPFQAEASAGRHRLSGHPLVPVATADRERWHREAAQLRRISVDRQRIADVLPVEPGVRDRTRRPDVRVPRMPERDGSRGPGDAPGTDTGPGRIAD
ncbi:MAG: hypothetical protein MUF48_02030, partial [Pirellulaceae bacterium]|nr:hypothetical protein [Pirellulaceae bacterium]